MKRTVSTKQRRTATTQERLEINATLIAPTLEYAVSCPISFRFSVFVFNWYVCRLYYWSLQLLHWLLWTRLQLVRGVVPPDLHNPDRRCLLLLLHDDILLLIGFPSSGRYHILRSIVPLESSIATVVSLTIEM